MRFVPVLVAAAAFAAPALAAAPSMTATPAAAQQGRILTNGAAWACVGATCTASSAASRPAILCERLAKEVGTLEAFAVDGKAFDDKALARCNAKAS
ncbi:CC_3452 family protein [Sphingomicrobium nitratireducens]|uniref:CC_3452 family protein n=1 Tax=Sphingomicrobium nitratireducens TaxID=2964666 RepID=UPI00224051AB|nr:hypothetical protein [Sphingomicrobium nitratireducens]